MRFTIISTNIGHQSLQDCCDFYAPGGTIGRGTDNNLVLPNGDSARWQAIIHVAADGECRITNYGNDSWMMLNDIPLERGHHVDLRDGDILSINEYRIEANDLIQDSQSVSRMGTRGQHSAATVPVHTEDALTEEPSEMWDDLMKEFFISDSMSKKPLSEVVPSSLAESKIAEILPDCLLAVFSNSEPPFERPPVVIDDLFTDDTLFNGNSIFSDITLTILVPPPETLTQSTPVEFQNELDPLILFSDDNAEKITRNGDFSGF